MSTASTLTVGQKKIVDAINRRNEHYAEIPSDEIIVVGGAALQMHNIKTTMDIDVVVTPERMEQVLTEQYRSVWGSLHRVVGRHGLLLTTTGRSEGQRIAGDEYGSTYGGITYMVAPNDHLYQATFEELLAEAVEIGGVLVSPPERILAWKRGVNRPKDAKDIALIEQYLA